MTTTVLLADAVPAYRGLVATKLQDLGVNVIEAESCATAVQAMEQTAADIAVIDNFLCNSSESDLLAELKRINNQLNCVLIVEPTLNIESPDEYCQSRGIAKLVRGPAHPGTIAKTVAELLRQGNAPGKACVASPSIAEDQDSRLANSQYELDDNAENHLQVVRRSYQEKLPEELEKLTAALASCKANHKNQEALRDAHRIAHTLHGTAGTLGFGEVSVAAGKIEEHLKWILGGGKVTDSTWEAIFLALDRAKTAPERASLIETPATRLSGIGTVLLVDSDEKMLASVELLAHQNLINIVPAKTREEALARASSQKVDGAIIDIHFGGRERAFELAQELRPLGKPHGLPIAIMSADSSILNRVAATHAGATLFLQKPLSAIELVEAVRCFGATRTEVSSKVLIVDDDEHFSSRIATILREEGMQVTCLAEPEYILEVIEGVKPDILLLDVVMPKISGFDVCRLLRSTAAWKQFPILFLTAENEPKIRLECFQAGGDDYIEKPVIKEELLTRIGLRLERIRLFKDRADRDSLTNLPNRRAFLEMFKLRIAEGKRYDRPLSLCILDLDDFKHINDSYGHLAGDRVLVGLGKLLSSRFRTVDVRGRWGGEEFAVVFYGEEAETAQLILNRALSEFKETVFEGDHGEKFQATFSGGVATFPKDGKTFDELFRVADQRLYVAKELGRNRIEI